MLSFEIPSLPDESIVYIADFVDLLNTGASILANYVPLSYLLTLFLLIVSIDVALGVYHFIMWILRKIPMLGIE